MENIEVNKQQKYCKFCGSLINMDAVVCTNCGRQVEELKGANPNVIINNSNVNSANAVGGVAKNKWVSFLLCLFTVCGHKFYEGKILMGIIYLFTGGLFAIGWFIDLISLLFKPNPYYV